MREAACRINTEKAPLSYMTRVSGQRLSTGYGLVTHFCLNRTGQIPKEATSLCTIGDYVGMRLCSRKTPLLHSSNAASLGLFDLRKSAFMSGFFSILEMDAGMLPPVTPRLEPLGRYHGIPVTTAIGDNQASFLGTAGFSTDAILVNEGTGGQISVASLNPFTSENIETRPLIDDKFLLVGSSLCGGRAYAVLEAFFRSYAKAAYGKDEDQYYVMGQLAEEGVALAGHSSMLVETAFSGTRSDPSKRGSISGLSEDNFTPAGLVYGTLSGIADELFRMWLEIRDSAGVNPQALYGAGNAIRKNRVLKRIFEEKFGLEMQLLPQSEEAACGAAKAGTEILY